MWFASCRVPNTQGKLPQSQEGSPEGPCQCLGHMGRDTHTPVWHLSCHAGCPWTMSLCEVVDLVPKPVPTSAPASCLLTWLTQGCIGVTEPLGLCTWSHVILSCTSSSGLISLRSSQSWVHSLPGIPHTSQKHRLLLQKTWV